jgi:phage shock protein C
MNDRLYRSRDDRLLAGVAGGLAEHWDADPSLVRLAWALLVIFTGGIALLVYIVMAIVVPEGETTPVSPMASGPGAPPVPDWQAEQSARRAAAREARRAARGDGGSRGGRTGALIIGGFLVLLGAWFLLDELVPWLDSDLLWPAALVFLGTAILVAAFRGRSEAPAGPGPSQPGPTATTGATGTTGTTVATGTTETNGGSGITKADAPGAVS